MEAVATGSAIMLSLSEKEAALAAWAVQEWTVTFEQVVAKGYMRRMPPHPTLDGRMLRIPLDLDSLEELDYQLTIGARECGIENGPGVEVEVGDRLAKRLHASLPANIRLAV